MGLVVNHIFAGAIATILHFRWHVCDRSTFFAGMFVLDLRFLLASLLATGHILLACLWAILNSKVAVRLCLLFLYEIYRYARFFVQNSQKTSNNGQFLIETDGIPRVAVNLVQKRQICVQKEKVLASSRCFVSIW